MSDRELPLFWLSFADDDRPAGEKFLGVCIVEGSDILTATNNAWEAGCNPGGQVLGFGPMPRDTYPEELWNRLLTRDEIAERDLTGTWEEHGLTPGDDGYLTEAPDGE